MTEVADKLDILLNKGLAQHVNVKWGDRDKDVIIIGEKSIYIVGVINLIKS